MRVVAAISAGGATVEISVIAGTEDAGLARIQAELPAGWRIASYSATTTDGVSEPSTTLFDGIN